MARIYQRAGSPNYWVDYTVPGKGRVRESAETDDARKAKRFLEARLKEIGAGRAVGPAVERVTFDDLAALYLQQCEERQLAWITSVRPFMEQLREYFGGWRVIDITTKAVREYVAWRREQPNQPSNGTINHHLAILRGMFNAGRKTEMVMNAPVIERLHVENARQGYFTHAEFIEFERHLPEYLRGPVRLGYYAGIRKGQVCALEWRDIDTQRNAIVFRAETVKNRSEHVIPLVGAIGDIIAEARKRRRLDCPFVFHRGGQKLYGNYRMAWAAALKAAGLGKKIPHDLRRSAARHLADAGLSEQEAMDITGHKTQGMFRRYNISDDGRRARSLEKMLTHLETAETGAAKVVNI